MVVNPSVPAKTVPEFIAYAKANPGKINMASNGIGTTAHVAGELFKMMTGVEMVHVPYRGPAPALTDLLAGKVQVRFGIPLQSIEYIRAGKLPALAVTTAARSEVLPDIPTVGEFVPGYEASAFFGLGAPKETPVEIVDKLNREINAALADPRIKARLAEVGGTVLAGIASRIQQAHRRRNRKMGQGDPGSQHQGGVRPTPSPPTADSWCSSCLQCFELGKLRLPLDARFECGDYFPRSQPDDRDGMGRVPYFIKIMRPMTSRH